MFALTLHELGLRVAGASALLFIVLSAAVEYGDSLTLAAVLRALLGPQLL
jgi:hypothetical protein